MNGYIFCSKNSMDSVQKYRENKLAPTLNPLNNVTELTRLYLGYYN